MSKKQTGIISTILLTVGGYMAFCFFSKPRVKTTEISTQVNDDENFVVDDHDIDIN